MSRKTPYGLAASLLLAVCMVPVLAASPAGATPVDGGALKNAHAVNGVMASADGISYTFKAVAGRHVTLAVTNVSVTPESSGFTLSAYDSHGDADVPGIQIFTGQPNEIDFTPTATQAGITTVVIGPWNAGATGTFTLTYSKDSTGALTAGKAVHPRLRFGGQHADYTFTAVAGQHVALAIVNPNLTPETHGMTLSIYDQNGDAVMPGVQFYTGQTQELDYTPTLAQAGVTHVVVTPFNYETTGTFTLGYATDITRRLALDKAVNADLKFPGQHAIFSFKTVAGVPADLLVTNANLSPVNTGELQMGVFDPNGNEIGSTRFISTDNQTQVYFVPTADQAGISTVGISPYTVNSHGRFTITYSDSFH